MRVKELCSLIWLPPKATEACEAITLSEKQITDEYALLCDNKDLFCEQAKSNPTKALALFVNFAARAKAEYDKRNISHEIYVETFKDIARWEAEHYSATNEHGLTECKWLANHVMLQLFQIKNLQFQPIEIATFALPNQAVGLPIFNLHIPKNADISPLAVDESCSAALEFFNCKKAVFCCGSWLLSPVLKELLNVNSKIALFGNRFNIVTYDNDTRQAEERIFGKLCDNPADYAEATSLQRAAKMHLINNGTIPLANGYFIAT